MNPKKFGVPEETPSQTLTYGDNRQDGSGCQVEVLASIGEDLPSFANKTRATAERWGKKGQFYKPLATQFRHDGFDYRQIAREGDVALYEQKWRGCPDPNVCFEVVRIRRRDGFQIGSTFVEPAEVYPRSEAWGTDGFTLTDKDAAFKKFQQMSPAEPAKPTGTVTETYWNRNKHKLKPKHKLETEHEIISSIR